MHQAVIDWLGGLKDKRPELFHDRRVLECGSLDINGTPRSFFTECEYIGIDWREGPCVDIVSLVHHYHPTDKFEIVISTEMLEHDPFWTSSLLRMTNLLIEGGHLFLTFGGRSRAEHEVDTSPVKGYYRGLSSYEVYRRIAHLFLVTHIWDDGNDVYVWGESKL